MPRRRNSYQPSLKTPEREDQDSLVIASSEEDTPHKQSKSPSDKHEDADGGVLLSDVHTLAVPKPAASALRSRGKGRLVRSEKHVTDDEDEEESLQQDAVATATKDMGHVLQLAPPTTVDTDNGSESSQFVQVNSGQSSDIHATKVTGGHSPGLKYVEVTRGDSSVDLDHQEVTGGQTSVDLKLTQQQNLSLEALCQAAKSELQIISKERGQGHLGSQEVVPMSHVGATTLPSTSSSVVEAGANVVVERQPGEGDVFHLVPISTAEGGDAWMLKSAGPGGVAGGNKTQVKVMSSQLSSGSLEAGRSLSLEGGPDASFEYVTDEEGSVAPPLHSGGRRRKHPQKPGKYVCTYCGRGCAKPSVLEKHIRAHTGERPYPCTTCGFSFKTKSNLYKHRKSRAHQVKAGIVPGNSSSVDSILTSMDSEDPELDDRSVDFEYTEPSSSISKPPTASKPTRLILPSNLIMTDLGNKGQLSASLTGGKPEQGRVIVLNKTQATAMQTAPAMMQRPHLILPQSSADHISTSQEVMSSSTQSAPVVTQPPQIRIIAPSPTVKQAPHPMFQILQLPTHSSEESSQQTSNSEINRTNTINLSPNSSETLNQQNLQTSYKSRVERVGDKSMKLTFELPKPGQEEGSGMPDIFLHPPGRQIGLPRTPLGSPSVVNIPKLPAPAKNITTDEINDRISYLISTNQAIVNTPMAEPPRPKRVMRQRSEIIEGVKSERTTSPLGRDLLATRSSLTTEAGDSLMVKEKISRALSVDVSQLRKFTLEKEAAMKTNNEELIEVIPLSDIKTVEEVPQVSDNIRLDLTSSSNNSLILVSQDDDDISLDRNGERKDNHLLEVGLPHAEIEQISDEDSASSNQFEDTEPSVLMDENVEERVHEELPENVKGEPVHIFLESHDTHDHGEFTEEGKSFACLECQLIFTNLKEVMSHLVEVCPAVHNAQGLPNNHKIHVFSEGHQSVLSVVVKKIAEATAVQEAEEIEEESGMESMEDLSSSQSMKHVDIDSATEVRMESSDQTHDRLALMKTDPQISRSIQGDSNTDTPEGSLKISSVSSSPDKQPPSSYSNVVLEVVDPTAPLKRGRPRGSKNRPKDQSQSYDSSLSVESVGAETAFVGSWKTPPIGKTMSFPTNVSKKFGGSSLDEQNPSGQPVREVEVVQYPVTEGMFRGYRSATPRRSNSQGKTMLSLNISPHGCVMTTRDESIEQQKAAEKVGLQVLTMMAPDSNMLQQVQSLGSSAASSSLTVPGIALDQHQLLQQVPGSTPKDDTKRKLQSHILMKRSLSTEKQQQQVVVTEAQKKTTWSSESQMKVVTTKAEGRGHHPHQHHHLSRSQSVKPPRNQKEKEIVMRPTKSLEEVHQPKRPRLERQASVFDAQDGGISMLTQGSDLDFILQKLNFKSQLKKSKTGLPHTVTGLKLDNDPKVQRSTKWSSKEVSISDQKHGSEAHMPWEAGSIEDIEVLENINGLKPLDKIHQSLTTLPMNELMLLYRWLNFTEAPCLKIPKNGINNSLQVLDLPKQLAMKIPGFVTQSEVSETDEPINKKMRLSMTASVEMDSSGSTVNAEREKMDFQKTMDNKDSKGNEESNVNVSDNRGGKDDTIIIDSEGDTLKRGEAEDTSLEEKRLEIDSEEVIEEEDKKQTEKEGFQMKNKMEADTKETSDNREAMEVDVEADNEKKRSSADDNDINEEHELTIETDEDQMKMSVSLSGDRLNAPSDPLTLPLSDGSNMCTKSVDNLTDLTTPRFLSKMTSDMTSDVARSGIFHIPKRLQEKPSIVFLYLGHSYPVLSSQTHPTLCSLTKPQPLYAQLTDYKKVSMYSTWRAAASNSNPDGMSTSDLLSLYRTHKNAKNSQYDPYFMTSEDGETTILSESSDWDTKKEATRSLDHQIDSQFEKWNASDNKGVMSKRQPVCTTKVFVKPEKKMTPGKKEEKAHVTMVTKSHDTENEMTRKEEEALTRPVVMDISTQNTGRVVKKAGQMLGHSDSSDRQTGSQDTEYTLKQITYTPGEQQYLVWRGPVTQRQKRHLLSAHGMKGFKSDDIYEYVRGRGRGKYVCQECGIRCKKPSMLRKHFRTHTDMRPYNCKYCSYDFKTKGNLTKHMKSKAHHRKCVSLGLSPIPTLIDDSCILSHDQMARLNTAPGDEDNNSRERTWGASGGQPDSIRQMGSSLEDEDDESESDEEEEEVEEEQVSMENMVVIGGEQGADQGTETGELVQRIVGRDTEEIVRVENMETGEPLFMQIMPGSEDKTRNEIVHVLKDVPVVDKEAADSLLELARREVKNAMAGTTYTGREGGDSLTSEERLGNLIGALLKRTTKDSDNSHMLKNPAIEVIKKPQTASQQAMSRSSQPAGSGFVPPSLQGRSSPDSHASKLPLVVKLPPGHYNVEETMRLLSQLLKGIIEEGQQVVIRGLEATGQNQPPSTGSNQLQLVQTSQVGLSVSQPGMVENTSITTSADHQYQVSTISSQFEPVFSSQIHSSPSDSVLYSSSQENTGRVRAPKLTILQRQAVVERQMKLQKKPSHVDESGGSHFQKPISRDQISPAKIIEDPQNQHNASDAKIIAPKRSNIVTTTVTLQSYLETLQKQEKDKNDEATKQRSSSKMGSCMNIMPIPGKVHEMTRVEGKYTCRNCGKTFQEGALLQQHLRVHEFEHTHRCGDCSVSFKSLEGLDKHLRSESHESVVNMKRRLGVSESTDPRPYRCDYCNIAFRNHGHLLKHLRSKSHVMQMESMGKLPAGTFLELEKLGTQINSSDADTFLKDVRGMIERGEISVSEDTPPPHHPPHLPPPSPYPPPHPPSSPTRSDSVIHEWVEVKQMNIATSVGPMKLPTAAPDAQEVVMARQGQESSTTVHQVETSVLKPSEDTSLERVTTEHKYRLQSPQRTHTQTAKLPVAMAPTPHKCGICGRAFERIVLLQEHLASHAELRPYVCEFCDAGFTTAKSLQTHLKSHTPSKKKYICGECGEVFTEVVDLVNHSSQACKASHLTEHQSRGMIPSPQISDNQATTSTLVLPPPARIDNQPTILIPQSANQSTQQQKSDNQPILMISSSQGTENQPKLMLSQPHISHDNQSTLVLSQAQSLEHQPTMILPKPQKTDNQPTYRVIQQTSENQPTLVIPPPHLISRNQYSLASSPQQSFGNQHSLASSGNQFIQVSAPLSSCQVAVTRSPHTTVLSGPSGPAATLQNIPQSVGESSNIQVIPVDGNSIQMRHVLQKQEDGSEKQVKVMVINWDSLQGN